MNSVVFNTNFLIFFKTFIVFFNSLKGRVITQEITYSNYIIQFFLTKSGVAYVDLDSVYQKKKCGGGGRRIINFRFLHLRCLHFANGIRHPPGVYLLPHKTAYFGTCIFFKILSEVEAFSSSFWNWKMCLRPSTAMKFIFNCFSVI